MPVWSAHPLRLRSLSEDYSTLDRGAVIPLVIPLLLGPSYPDSVELGRQEVNPDRIKLAAGADPHLFGAPAGRRS